MKYEIGMKINVGGQYTDIVEVILVKDNCIVANGITRKGLTMYYIEDDGCFIPYLLNEDHFIPARFISVVE